MKRLLLPAMLISSFSLHGAVALKNYDDVVASFKAGSALKLQVQLNQCEGSSLKRSGSEFSVDVNPIMMVHASLKFSTTHFTRNNLSHPGVSIFEYVRYVLSEDNNVRITVQYSGPHYL